jgi:hypothetical protein
VDVPSSCLPDTFIVGAVLFGDRIDRHSFLTTSKEHSVVQAFGESVERLLLEMIPDPPTN